MVDGSVSSVIIVSTGVGVHVSVIMYDYSHNYFSNKGINKITNLKKE